MASLKTVRAAVRKRYAAAARAAATAGDAQTEAGCCLPTPDIDGGAFGKSHMTPLSDHTSAPTARSHCGTPAASAAFGASLYDDASRDQVPDLAVEASLGCGVPTAVADLHEGETVLDLGSGAGADVLISARRVGPTGTAIGLDMTDEMLALARRNAAEAGIGNVEFRKGYIEEIPVADETVDVVISNCVINLSADKARVIREAARVMRPGGRFAVSDVIADPDMDAATRTDMRQWTGCIAGALTRDEYERHLRDAGLGDIEIRETHRVHEHAAAAIIRARKPDREAA
jgi:arsenite methyltransferase